MWSENVSRVVINSVVNPKILCNL